MTVTHIGTYWSSYTWLDSSTWYSKDEYKSAYLNFYRELYKTYYQMNPNYYNQLMETIEASSESYANSYFASSTGTYYFYGDTLYIGGVMLTKN